MAVDGDGTVVIVGNRMIDVDKQSLSLVIDG